MIDDLELREFIENRIPFRLGARGICVDFKPGEYGIWEVTIPRAFIEFWNVDDVNIEGTDLVLACESGYVGTAKIDLTKYDKLTCNEVRI